MPLSINPITTIKPFVRTAVATGSLLLASQAICSCSKTENKTDTFEKESKDSIYNAEPEVVRIDLTKPNLPIIKYKDSRYGNNYTITFTELDGTTRTFDCGNEKAAIFKAITKYSTYESPDITNVHGFINEALYQGSASGSCYGNNSHQILEKAIEEAKAKDSDKGYIITVKEYTETMHGLSGTICVGYNL